MNILWFVNILLPEIAIAIGAPSTPFGGWMVSLSTDLAKREELNLAIATFYNGNGIKKLRLNNITYYLIPGGQKAMLQRGTQKLKSSLREIVKDFNPNLLHIHGTEYTHGLTILEDFADVPSMVSIQGLLGVIEKHFYAGMEFSDVFLRPSLRDIIKFDPLWNWRRSFRKRAVFERDIFKKVNHVIGRTTWDYANVKAINPKLIYHHCNEGLRDPFYRHQWDIMKIERHTVFITQASYPIKGMHILLKAISILKRDYPDVKVYVAGQHILGHTFYTRLKVGGYALYIKRLIKILKLQENVVFTGVLDGEGIVNILLKSNVFVVPSAVENSPNSLGEAMILGVPCVASYVGGVPDMLENGRCGFLYPFMEEAMLAEYIRQIFDSDELALNFSQASRETANKRHDRNRITETMLGIYNAIGSCTKRCD